jgi:hypothetical protein
VAYINQFCISILERPNMSWLYRTNCLPHGPVLLIFCYAHLSIVNYQSAIERVRPLDSIESAAVASVDAKCWTRPTAIERVRPLDATYAITTRGFRLLRHWNVWQTCYQNLIEDGNIERSR